MKEDTLPANPRSGLSTPDPVFPAPPTPASAAPASGWQQMQNAEQDDGALRSHLHSSLAFAFLLGGRVRLPGPSANALSLTSHSARHDQIVASILRLQAWLRSPFTGNLPVHYKAIESNGLSNMP